MRVLATNGRVLRINAPEWFLLSAFRELLDRGTHADQRQRLATFHRHGDVPNEFSDIFIPFDAFPIGLDDWGRELWRGEGSDLFDAEGLEEVSNAIVTAAQQHQINHGIVWISNLPFDS
jgi:hypothetical protein